MRYRIGVDVGGTFTDFLVVRSDGSIVGEKTPSTPPDFSVGILDGLGQLAAAELLDTHEFLQRTDLIVHGTTAVTNALLTRSGAKTALLTTRGFRDALEMRRGVKERIYDNKDPAPVPLVPRERRLPVGERTLWDGSVIEETNADDVLAAAASLRQAGVEAVAICFLHAYANGSNEDACRALIERELPGVFVTTSAALLPKIAFYDRLSTTVVNAYAGPLLGGYVNRLHARLAAERFQGTLLVMLSSGGVATVDVAARTPAAAVGSGPAGGAIAGMRYAAAENHPASVTFDMGGTSLDLACVLDGRVGRVRSTDVNRLRVAMPMVDVVSVGAGGGSIARVDAGGLLHVGPESAGADPGPVAYGRGGEHPTVTDANLLLGFLNPSGLLGGRVSLDRALAADAIRTHVAEPLGTSPLEAAMAIFQVVNASMASSVREFLYERGQDPEDFSLVAAGGAGPLHAAHVARDLGIRTVIVPRNSALFSSVGLLVADLKHDFVQTDFAPVRELDAARLRSLYETLRARGKAVLDEEGIAPIDQRFEYSADLRYERQIHEIEVPIEPEMLARAGEALELAFAARHREAYGYELAESPVEFINARVSAIGRTPDFWFPDMPPVTEQAVITTSRAVLLPPASTATDVPIYDVERLGPGSIVHGAAMVEGPRLSLLVPDRATLSVNRWGDFAIQMQT
jgi:N-methylhydantoinase A